MRIKTTISVAMIMLGIWICSPSTGNAADTTFEDMRSTVGNSKADLENYRKLLVELEKAKLKAKDQAGATAAKLEIIKLDRELAAMDGGSARRPSRSEVATEKAVADKAAADKAAAEKAAAEKVAAQKAAAEKTDAEKAAVQKTAAEKAAEEKTAAQKAAAEKAAAQKAAEEKTAAQKAAAEKAAEEKAAAQKAAEEKAAAQKAAEEKAAAQKAAEEKASAQKAAAEKVAAQKAAAQKAAEEKAAEEKAAEEKAAAEKTATEKAEAAAMKSLTPILRIPQTHASSVQGLAGAHDYSQNNVYVFSLDEVGLTTTLSYYATGRRSKDTAGNIWLVNPDGRRERVAQWKSGQFEVASSEVSSYSMLKPVTVDISGLVKGPGAYRVEFEWTDGIAPLVIYRVEITS